MLLSGIKLFCDVAHHRSISKAAADNGVTQSAASQRIATIERELGVQLVDRSTRPLQLTLAGQTFYEGCRKILSRYDRLRKEVSTHAPQLRGELRISAIYSAGIVHLSRAREDFEKLHPRVRVKIAYLQPTEVYQRIRREECDFGILSYPQHWRGLASIPLRSETMALVCKADHRLATRTTIRPGDLAEEALVNFDTQLPISSKILKYFKENGVSPTISQTFDNIDTIKNCVAATGALAVLPAETVEWEVRTGALASIPLAPKLLRPVAIEHVRGRDLSLPARIFIQFLQGMSQPANKPTKTTPAPDPPTDGDAAEAEMPKQTAPQR